MDPRELHWLQQVRSGRPHAAIRPFLLNAEEEAAKPAAFVTKEAKGKGFEGLTFRMQVDPLDCQGCGACAQVCPAKEKAPGHGAVVTQIPSRRTGSMP